MTTTLPPAVDEDVRTTVLEAVAALADIRVQHPDAYTDLVREAADFLTLDPVACSALTALAPGSPGLPELTSDVLAALTVTLQNDGRSPTYDEVRAALDDPGAPLCEVIRITDAYASGALRETLKSVRALDSVRFRDRLNAAALLIGLARIRDALAAGTSS